MVAKIELADWIWGFVKYSIAALLKFSYLVQAGALRKLCDQ
jgi:hypothetical protein